MANCRNKDNQNKSRPALKSIQKRDSTGTTWIFADSFIILSSHVLIINNTRLSYRIKNFPLEPETIIIYKSINKQVLSFRLTCCRRPVPWELQFYTGKRYFGFVHVQIPSSWPIKNVDSWRKHGKEKKRFHHWWFDEINRESRTICI